MAAATAAVGVSTDSEAPVPSKTKSKDGRTREEPGAAPRSCCSSSSLTSSSPPPLHCSSSSSFKDDALCPFSCSSSSSASSASSSSDSTFAACSFFTKEKKKGVLYIARLPPRMNRVTLRQYFERFGKLGRLHVSALLEEGRGSTSASARRQSNRGRQPMSACDENDGEDEEKKKKKGVASNALSYRIKAFGLEFAGGAEAWLEFVSRKDAKKVARLLDGQPVSSWAAGMGHGRGSARKARRQWNGDIWCLKYLRGFTWQQLIEEKLYSRRVRQDRLNAALSQIKRENAVYVQLVEQQKQIDRMRENKQAKKLALQDKEGQLNNNNTHKEQKTEYNNTIVSSGSTHAQRHIDNIGKIGGLVGGNLWETNAATARLHANNSSSCNDSSTNTTGSCRSKTSAAEVKSPAQASVRTPKRKRNGAGEQQEHASKNGTHNLNSSSSASHSKRIREDSSYASLFALF